jgi:biotin carboxyl carrier protein
MTCDLETPGGRRAIELRRRGSVWELTLDGRILSVDVTAIAGRWSVLIGPPSADGFGETGAPSKSAGRQAMSYEVAVERRSNGERIVYVNGVAVPVAIMDPRLVRRRGTVSAETGPRSIVSPMPGRIVKVLVREGDVVAAQQGLVVVEAMKMENEVRAPRAGQVSAVKVVEGMSVEAKSVLVTLA